jgi:hypothetical protein
MHMTFVASPRSYTATFWRLLTSALTARMMMHNDRALPASGSCTGAAAIPCRIIHRLPLLECIGLLTAEEQTEGGVTLPL